MASYDSRPHGAGGSDTTVKLIDDPNRIAGPMQAEGYQPRYVVLAREGDTLTLRRLGFPDDASIQVPVSVTYPASPGAVYRSGVSRCGS